MLMILYWERFYVTSSTLWPMKRMLPYHYLSGKLAPWTYTHKNWMLWSKTCIHCYHTTEAKPYIQAFSMFIILIKQQNTICRDEIVKNTYLMNNLSPNQLRHCNLPPNHRPVCSLIFQQPYHPRVGHDCPRNKGQIGLHIAKDTLISQANIVGFIRISQS